MGGNRSEQAFLTADAAGLVGCTMCGRAWPRGEPRCQRCGSVLRSPDRSSLQYVWAWLFAGLIFYIPANLFPMLYTDTLVADYGSTIIGGVIDFIAWGDYFVGTVIFFASVVIPVAKFGVIAFLALSVGRGTAGGVRHQHVYEIVEFIGRWSMVDVFVVAILSALVQLGLLASMHPGPAAAAFALSVAFTMLAAHSFDSRLVWQSAGKSATTAPQETAAGERVH